MRIPSRWGGRSQGVRRFRRENRARARARARVRARGVRLLAPPRPSVAAHDSPLDVPVPVPVPVPDLVLARGKRASMKAVNSLSAPSAIGPYSQAVDAGDFVFLSGQV